MSWPAPAHPTPPRFGVTDLAANLAGIALGGLSATRLTRVARL
jgi:hypothetical protein